MYTQYTVQIILVLTKVYIIIRFIKRYLENIKIYCITSLLRPKIPEDIQGCKSVNCFNRTTTTDVVFFHCIPALIRSCTTSSLPFSLTSFSIIKPTDRTFGCAQSKAFLPSNNAKQSMLSERSSCSTQEAWPTYDAIINGVLSFSVPFVIAWFTLTKGGVDLFISCFKILTWPFWDAMYSAVNPPILAFC